MKRYSQQQISDLLDKFMDGLKEWEDYRLMFGYFDRGMEGELISQQVPERPLLHQMGRRWWGIAAAAAMAALIVTTAVLHQPTTTQSVVAEVAQENPQEQATPIGETQDFASLQTTPEQPVETQDVASLQTTEQSPETSITRPVETQNLASQTRSARPNRSTRRLQAENAKLARENERLQRELADLKRRAFIIDLEANGFRAVQDEDGSIVLIDLEQELENELNNQLNNQPTTNMPAL